MLQLPTEAFPVVDLGEEAGGEREIDKIDADERVELLTRHRLSHRPQPMCKVDEHHCS